MLLNDAEINPIAASILADHRHLFPTTYPDIPLNLAMLKDALQKAGLQPEKEDIPEIMQQVELALAALVPLNWNNYGTIAILLNQQHPGEDLLAITENRIIELTNALPNFSDDTGPQEDVIDSIIYTWISLTDDEANLTEDDAWA